MSQTERKLIINTAGGAAANMKQKEIPSTKNDAQKCPLWVGFGRWSCSVHGSHVHKPH